MKSIILVLTVLFCGTIICACGVSAQPADSTAPAATTAPAEPEKPQAAPGVEKQTADIDAALDKGIEYLASIANKDDGSWGVTVKNDKGEEEYHGNVGITGLVIGAIANSPYKDREAAKDYFKKGVEYLLKNVQENGAISNKGQGLDNYRTSCAIMALQAVDAKKYADTIKKAQDFIKSLQRDDKVNEAYYGGIGYSHDNSRPDLSNAQMAIEALRETGVAANDEVIKKSIVFLQRCQNNTSTNDYDQKQADMVPVNDGGARYSPTESKIVVTVAGGKKSFPSYGSMTYAFLKSMIYAGVDKKDPRVRAAYHWILNNYDLDKNPGFSTEENKTAAQQGLYYYYHTMSKALLVMGDHVLKTPDGNLHNWALELSAKIIGKQNKDGSWFNAAEARWFEGNPSLVTAYVVAVLNNCRKDLQDQAEFLKNAPAKEAELQKDIENEKAEGDQEEVTEAQEELDALKEAAADIQKTWEASGKTEKP